MESALIRYFREVYRCGSIREASANLNVAPSAVSRQIMKLEDQLGVALFERRPRGVAPTEAGEVLARFARDVQLDITRLHGEIDAINGLRRGHVRLLSTEGLVSHVLTGLVAAFSARYPGIGFSLTITGTAGIAEGIKAGEADIGFAFDAEPDPQLDFALQIRDPLCLVTAPGHPLLARETLTMADLAAFPFGLPQSSFAIRRLIDAEFRRERIALQPAMETNSIEALRGLVRSGMLIACLPSLPIRGELDAGLLVSRPLPVESFKLTTHDICVLANRPLPPAVAAFLTHTRQTLAPPG
ncbi:LysR family transcriptional regulator [Arsenicitalea aurantiaca]|nr:LysR family transcriptional regulator [Arsenicitalea aurantiaca]